MNTTLAYYAEPGFITNPGDHADLFADLPHDVPKLARIVEGLLLHPISAHVQKIHIAQARFADQTVRPVSAKLARIREFDERPLRFGRSHAKRVVNQCYGFATLLCAMLRYQHVPVRVRSGFAFYLSTPELVYNHWLCEYWHDKEQRWVLVEPDFGDEQHAGFNPNDVPRHLFQTAPEVWLQCRAGKADPRRYGFDEVRGYGYIGCQLMHDLACLNKEELLATDRWGVMDDSVQQYDAETTALLDHVATLATSDDKHFYQLRDLYEQDERLRAPRMLVDTTCV